MNNIPAPCLGCAMRSAVCHLPGACDAWDAYKARCQALILARDHSRQSDEDARAVRKGREKRRHYNHV